MRSDTYFGGCLTVTAGAETVGRRDSLPRPTPQWAVPVTGSSRRKVRESCVRGKKVRGLSDRQVLGHGTELFPEREAWWRDEDVEVGDRPSMSPARCTRQGRHRLHVRTQEQSPRGQGAARRVSVALRGPPPRGPSSRAGESP